MNDEALALAAGLVDAAYVRQGAESLRVRAAAVRSLLAQRRLPVEGWRDADIELLLHELAAMDSNNFAGHVGLGEREARIASRLVAARHYRLGHGVGRSGELAAAQPKAAGSSLLARLAAYFVAEVLQLAGASRAATAGCVVVPLATGMTLALVLLALRQLRPRATVVLWPRIDQKSCLKAIVAAGADAVLLRRTARLPPHAHRAHTRRRAQPRRGRCRRHGPRLARALPRRARPGDDRAGIRVIAQCDLH